MDDCASATIQTSLILNADRLYAALLSQLTLREFPQARVLIASSVEAAAQALLTQPIDLFVAGIGASLDGDVLDLLTHATHCSPGSRRTIVVMAQQEYRVLAALRTLEVAGVFDAAIESPETFQDALRAVAVGSRYWSAGYVETMNKTDAAQLCRQLTTFEQMVLSVIGDGCDDATAALELGLKPATIGTVRRELHRKLHVQHRGELVRAAAQHGFVRFTPTGVVRPGFALLSAAYRPKKVRDFPASERGASLATLGRCSAPALEPVPAF